MSGVKEIVPRTWLKKFREDSGLTMDALARKVGITPQMLWLIESGQRAPGLLVGISMADTLGFDVHRFVEEEQLAS